MAEALELCPSAGGIAVVAPALPVFGEERLPVGSCSVATVLSSPRSAKLLRPQRHGTLAIASDGGGVLPDHHVLPEQSCGSSPGIVALKPHPMLLSVVQQQKLEHCVRSIEFPGGYLPWANSFPTEQV